MKKTITITTLALLAGGVSAFAQGQISFGDGPDSGGAIGIQIFGVQGGPVAINETVGTTVLSGGTETMGSNGNTYGYDTSPGHAVYTSSPLGAGYSVELLAGTSATTLAPVGTPETTWYTGDPVKGLGGYWKSGQIITVPTVAAGGTAFVQVAAWNNMNGTINDLATAVADNAAWGVSTIGQVTLGGGINVPASLPTTLQTFSLASTIPEPSTIALGVMGASTLLFRRRK